MTPYVFYSIRNKCRGTYRQSGEKNKHGCTSRIANLTKFSSLNWDKSRLGHLFPGPSWPPPTFQRKEKRSKSGRRRVLSFNSAKNPFPPLPGQAIGEVHFLFSPPPPPPPSRAAATAAAGRGGGRRLDRYIDVFSQFVPPPPYPPPRRRRRRLLLPSGFRGIPLLSICYLGFCTQ